MLLLKGIEVELFTGTFEGESVGFARSIAADLPGFVCEPDNRNVEYVTPPFASYGNLMDALIKPRQSLRRYLHSLGDYTILPGSTLTRGNTHQFHRSTPNNPYHTYIEQTYGTNVVTAGIHINVGIPDVEMLIKACRLIRMEAPLYLALSASSPFLDGKATGWDSTRWHLFPQTPETIPLFASHQHFIQWTEEQLSNGTMQNVRHLWCSVRPNGPARPYQLNRLELRICDLVMDPTVLLAITAFLEMRILMLLNASDNSRLDPLSPYSSIFTPDELISVTTYNEHVAAADSLDAQMIHWQTGELIPVREWLFDSYRQVQEIAKANGVDSWLSPILDVIKSGNESKHWLGQYDNGQTLETIFSRSIQTAEQQERALLNAAMATSI